MRNSNSLTKFRSIRFRLTLWYAVVLTAGLGVFSVLLWLSLRHQLLGDLEHSVDAGATRLESYFRAESAKPHVDLPDELEEFCQALPPESYVILRGSNGFLFQYPAAISLTKVRAEQQRFYAVQRRFTLPNQSFDLDVGSPLEEVQHVLRLLTILLWSLIPLVIALATAGGAWLSGRALKPVKDVTGAALLISIENLSDRVPVPATGDEIAVLAEVLNSMLARLEAAVKMLSQFAADASHELRTPLAVIRTTAELALRRGRSLESYRDSLREVVSEAERMTGLVEELLDLARSGSQVAELPRMALDVREVLQEVCTSMHGLAQARRIRLTLSLDEVPANISGNRAALYRLFMVLLDNAIKFSSGPGLVIVQVSRDAETVAVNIQDFGTGIPAADLRRIFDRFYRSKSDHIPADQGHGLGLPLAENIARAHGAFIQVKSEAGQGSIFTVRFPGREWEPEHRPDARVRAG